METLPIELEKSWASAWAGVGAQGDGLAVQGDLLARYSEPHRAYHTLQHLQECLQRLAQVRDHAEHPHAVELALWFHDAVYDQAGSNEKRSADLAKEAMQDAQAPESMVDLVQSLILATCHDVAPQGADEMTLIDVDLSILGAAVDALTNTSSRSVKSMPTCPRSHFASAAKPSWRRS